MSYTSKTYPEPIVSMYLEGRLWFDKSAGNTYHSVRVFINGKLFGATGMEYGYENAYEYATLQKLIDLEILPKEAKSLPLWRVANIYSIHIYSSSNYVPRKQLWTATEEFA